MNVEPSAAFACRRRRSTTCHRCTCRALQLVLEEHDALTGRRCARPGPERRWVGVVGTEAAGEVGRRGKEEVARLGIDEKGPRRARRVRLGVGEVVSGEQQVGTVVLVVGGVAVGDLGRLPVAGREVGH